MGPNNFKEITQLQCTFKKKKKWTNIYGPGEVQKKLMNGK